MLKYKKVFPIMIVFLFSLSIFTGCFTDPDQYLKDDNETFVLETLDPKGNVAVSYEIINLKVKQKTLLKQNNYKAALLFHTDSDFTEAVIRGVQHIFDESGIEIIAIKNAEMNSTKQEEQLLEVLEKSPDIIISLVVDSEKGAAAFRKAVDQGVKLVFLSTLPKGFSHGKDYASLVSDDLFAMGNNVAEMIGDSLGGKGEVVLLYHDAQDYYVTNQRDLAVKTVLSLRYPEIKIAAEIGVNSSTDMNKVILELESKKINYHAIYVPWGTLAEDVKDAFELIGRIDIRIFTIDLEENIAINLARKGHISGIVSDFPYLMGETLAEIGGLSLLNRRTPAFVILPAVKITQDNLAEKWEEVRNEKLPENIQEVLNGAGVHPGLEIDP